MSMYQGNWKCSTCGGAITELPFQPRSESGLTCRACYGKQKGSSSDGGSSNEDQTLPEEMETAGAPEDLEDIPDYAEVVSEPAPHEDFAPDMVPSTSERPKFTGDWKCAGCEAPITSLPFAPRDTSGLKCIDCFKKSRG